MYSCIFNSLLHGMVHLFSTLIGLQTVYLENENRVGKVIPDRPYGIESTLFKLA